MIKDRMTDPLSLRSPHWQLTVDRTYRVEVRVSGANVDHTDIFKLEYYSGKFTDFQLQSVKA